MNTANQAQRGPYRKHANVTPVYRLRFAAKLSQQQAAKAAGVSLRTFQRCESGDCVPFHTRRAVERSLGLFL